MIKFDVKNRFSGEVQFTAKIDCADNVRVSVKLRLAVEWARSARANLIGADLADVNLTSANLADANLTSADLTRANLIGADLTSANLASANLASANLARANLIGANLIGADLTSANLASANLASADLIRANLIGANLTSADLTRANLADANLTSADLTRANLTRANLADANLTGARLPPLSILPEGTIIGWKKLQGGIIAKLEIPATAQRTNSTGRKCRAEYANVVELIGADVGYSQRDKSTEYRVGITVRPDSFDPDFRVECSHGIHFFITRKEAESYC